MNIKKIWLKNLILVLNLSTLLFIVSACSSTHDKNILSSSSSDSELNQDSLKEEKALIPTNYKKTKVLKVLLQNSTNTFFIYKGENCGLEYELLSLFAKDQGYDLQISLIKDAANSKQELYEAQYHLAAGSFIKPLADKSFKYVAFSDPVYHTQLCLVAHKETLIDTTAAMNVLLLKGSAISDYIDSKHTISYIDHVKSKQDMLNHILEVDHAVSMIDMEEALIAQAFNSALKIEQGSCSKANVAFLINKGRPELNQEFNAWLQKRYNTSDYQWIIKKYKKLPSTIAQLVKFDSPVLNKIYLSKYDQQIKLYAAQIDWDWRMLSALVHQESRFEEKKKSWVGALGLMQVMPKVAHSYAKVKKRDLYFAKPNLKAGTIYLQWLMNNFYKEISDEKERVKFILASYNSGVGHVSDARALAMKHGYDANKWTNHVEKMMLLKSDPKYFKDPVCKYGFCRGQEPVMYVKNILKYYQEYCDYYP